MLSNEGNMASFKPCWPLKALHKPHSYTHMHTFFSVMYATGHKGLLQGQFGVQGFAQRHYVLIRDMWSGENMGQTTKLPTGRQQLYLLSHSQWLSISLTWFWFHIPSEIPSNLEVHNPSVWHKYQTQSLFLLQMHQWCPLYSSSQMCQGRKTDFFSDKFPSLAQKDWKCKW